MREVIHRAERLSQDEDRACALSESLSLLQAGAVDTIVRSGDRTHVSLERGTEFTFERVSFQRPRATFQHDGETSELDRRDVSVLSRAIQTALKRILTD